ncbi:MAG: hypothetical protein M0R80_03740 [Proteobacteria bacterium]|jgi:hypothetical protein|nr:hypothetical protein [Pseudomonadota bacterium]
MRKIIGALVFIFMMNMVDGTQTTVEITETTTHIGNHLYSVKPVCEVYSSWEPGMVRLYHVVAPFTENYDNTFVTSTDSLKELLNSKCWVNATEPEMWVYATHMSGTRALYKFYRTTQLVSGEDYGGEGIGDHIITTNPDGLIGYTYMGILGFVPWK